MRHFLGKFEALALSETCTVSSGGIYSETAYEDLPCLLMPPKNQEDDVVCDILVKDTSGVIDIGSRLTHSSATYLVMRLSIDGNYVRAACQKWGESNA